MKKRMYELAKTRRGLKKEKAHKRSVYGLSGVPGATRTPGLPLRSCGAPVLRRYAFYYEVRKTPILRRFSRERFSHSTI